MENVFYFFILFIVGPKIGSQIDSIERSRARSSTQLAQNSTEGHRLWDIFVFLAGAKNIQSLPK